MATKPNVTYVLKRDEPIEKALRGFKRLCERAGIKKAVRAKRYYEKPSERRRREARKQVRNKRRAERKAKQAMERRMKKARRRSSSLAYGGPIEAEAASKPAEKKPEESREPQPQDTAT